jgi:hypothetical protein
MACSVASSYHSGGPRARAIWGGGGFADVLQDGPNVHRLGDEGDDAHLGAALRAGQRKRLVDARQQHHPMRAGDRRMGSGESSAAVFTAQWDTTASGARAVTAGRSGEFGAITQ